MWVGKMDSGRLGLSNEKQSEKLPLFVCLIGIFATQKIDHEDLAKKY